MAGSTPVILAAWIQMATCFSVEERLRRLTVAAKNLGRPEDRRVALASFSARSVAELRRAVDGQGAGKFELHAGRRNPRLLHPAMLDQYRSHFEDFSR